MPEEEQQQKQWNNINKGMYGLMEENMDGERFSSSSYSYSKYSNKVLGDFWRFWVVHSMV